MRFGARGESKPVFYENCEEGLVVIVVPAMEETHPGCRASMQRARSALLAASQPSLYAYASAVQPMPRSVVAA